MTETLHDHPQIGQESRIRWILTGPTYAKRFTLASLGWIPRTGYWYFTGQDQTDYALKYARSLRGTRIAKRFVVQGQGRLGI